MRGANGCTATATAIVTQDIAAPNATAQGGALTCAAVSIALQASSTTPSVTFNWTGPGAFTSSQQNPVVATPGNYTLTVRSKPDEITATLAGPPRVWPTVPKAKSVNSRIIPACSRNEPNKINKNM